MINRFILLILLITFSFESNASRLKKKDYFASLRSSKTNVRVGPGLEYSIKYVFHLKSVPVRVVAEYDNWSEIIDYNNDRGWINQNLLTKRRSIIIKSRKKFVGLYKARSIKSKILLKMQNDVIAYLIKCKGDWCGIQINGEKGWVKKNNIWGI